MAVGCVMKQVPLALPLTLISLSFTGRASRPHASEVPLFLVAFWVECLHDLCIWEQSSKRDFVLLLLTRREVASQAVCCA